MDYRLGKHISVSFRCIEMPYLQWRREKFGSFVPSAVYFYKYHTIDEIKSDLVGTNSAETSDICPIFLAEDVWAFEEFYSPNNNYLAYLTKTNNLTTGELEVGGRWKPKWCRSQYKVAIVVPYRNRKLQLDMFLAHMHHFLRSQLIDYTIIVVEQGEALDFNRGALFNVGFLEGLKLNPDLHCFIFHDVDLLPINKANIYACSKMPRHMSVSVNSFRFNLPYTDIFGGVVSMTTEQFKLVNGFSNIFFGWGGEDDDMLNRIINCGLEITRWSPKISRYYMLPHAKAEPNSGRFRLLKEGQSRFAYDGLNSIEYQIINIHKTIYGTFISVDF
ncbi:hypothetical protein CHUAL_006861 [Chamberlinius hualienensis]